MSDQHNRMLKWMYEEFPRSICQVYKATGGGCHTFIGPLEANQGSIPIEFHSPEDQPTLGVRLQQIENSLSVDRRDVGFVPANFNEHHAATDMEPQISQTLKLDEMGEKIVLLV